MADERMFQEAIEAIRSGQRGRARDLLTRLLRTVQDDPNLWLYMSAVVESEKERIYCLESALKLDPNNEAARRGLVMLGAAPPDESVTPVRPQRSREWEVGTLAGMDGEGEGKERTRIPIGRLALLAVIGLAVTGLVVFGIVGARRRAASQFANLGPTSTPRPLFAASASATLDATEQASAASTPVVDGPTPLALLLQATYTPTARYVDTPHPSDESFRTALTNLGRGNYDQALSFLDQFLQNNPESTDGIYYRGLILMGKGDYRGAKNEFNRVIALDSRFGPAYLGRAQADLAINPEANIEDDIDRAIDLSPEFAEGFLARAEYRLERGDAESALEDAQAALNLRPDSPLAFHLIARAQLELGDEAAALEAAQTASSLDFTLLDNYLTLGQALVANGRPAEAIGPIQTYLYFHGDNTAAWLQLGRAQQEGGYPENAIRVYEYVLQLDRTQYRTYHLRGLAYATIGDYASAIRDLRAAAQTFKDDFRIQMDFGIVLHQAGYSGDGYLVIHAAAPLAQTDEQKAEFYYWRATTLQKIGEWSAAERDWNLLLELPEDVVPPEWAAAAAENLKVITGTITATATSVGARTPTPLPGSGTPEPGGTPASATPSPTP
ncbi:MAG: tetratricopeptide repeat protein [Chloroflexi bacterium]|nr:tetratricopeptide repeat protein [Chloroflexota bacterium]